MGDALAELQRLVLKRLVGEFGDLGLEGADLSDARPEFFQRPLVLRPEEVPQNEVHAEIVSNFGGPPSLEGPGDGAPFVHRVYYEDIESVFVGRGNGDRLAGRPALVLDRAVGGRLRIGSVNGVGVLTELASRLGRLTATSLAV